MSASGEDAPTNAENRVGWSRVAAECAGPEEGEDDPLMRELIRGAFVARLPEVPEGARVLEVGCGPGTDSARFAERGLRVTASDFAPEFIEIVRARHPGLEARVMDMTAPDLPPESFDGIYGFATFVHLPRDQALPALTGMRQLLVPGGTICLSLISSSKGIREYRIEEWAGDPECSMGFTCYEHEEARALFESAGYTAIEVLPTPPSVYDTLPRLVERGVKGFLVFAQRPQA